MLPFGCGAMFINFPMTRRLVLRAANRRFVSLYALAKETVTLCPEEKISLPKAIYLDGSLDRITGLSRWRWDWQQESELIFGGKIVAHASCAYRVEDADIVEAHVYRGPAKIMPGYGTEKVFLGRFPEREIIEKANLVTTFAGSQFFGPLIVDDFPLELNADNPAENIKMVTKPYSHEDDYRRLLGLQATRLVVNARIRNLTLYSQPAISSLRASQYRELRRRLRASMPDAKAVRAPGVYLKRGDSGERRMLRNEPEIEQALTRLGFDIVEPAGMSVEDIVRRTLDAKIVVSVEGSHKSHMVLSMAERGALVVLQPPDRFSMVYKECADCMDIRFGFVVGNKAPDGFTVETADLLRLLDRISGG